MRSQHTGTIYKCSDRMCGADDCSNCRPGCAEYTLITCDVCNDEVDLDDNDEVIECEGCGGDVCPSCQNNGEPYCAQCVQDNADCFEEGDELDAYMWYHDGVCYYRLTDGRIEGAALKDYGGTLHLVGCVRHRLTIDLGISEDNIEWIGAKP